MLGAAGGIATLLLERLGGKPLIPPAQAQPTPLYIDQYPQTASGTTGLISSVVSAAAFRAVASGTGGIGVRGEGATGLSGLSPYTTGYPNYGVYGCSYSSNGIGVGGDATAYSGLNWGVVGFSNSTSGTGVLGYVAGTSGVNRGVYGESESTSGFGVCGFAYGVGVDGVGGVGVRGSALSSGAIAMVAKGASGQSANLQEWQNNAGTALSVVDKDGKLGVGTGSPLYACDVRTPGFKAAQMHFASTDTDAGGYFVSAGDANFYVSGGAAYNGTSWIAKAASAYIIGGDASGIRFFQNSGLTAGSPFSPTLRMKIDPAGKVGIGTSTPSSRLHVTSDSATSGDTGVVVDIPGVGMRRVVVGPPDSGGTGYRSLRVVN